MHGELVRAESRGDVQRKAERAPLRPCELAAIIPERSRSQSGRVMPLIMDFHPARAAVQGLLAHHSWKEMEGL